MVRAVRLALLFLATVAAPAQAYDGGGVAGAAQVIGGSSHPSLHAVSVGALPGAIVNGPRASAALLPQRRKRQGSGTFPWFKHGRSAVAVPLTERLRLGIGYRHLEGEDLWPEFVDTGAAGYDSHHLLIRASWRF